MNAAVLKIEKAMSIAPEKQSPMSTANGNGAETKKRFALYFAEQSIALFGTWVQQVVVGWLIHVAPHTLSSISFVSPQVGATLSLFCSAITWLLLTVWSFKLREHLRHVASVCDIIKHDVSSIRLLPQLYCTNKMSRHCS